MASATANGASRSLSTEEEKYVFTHLTEDSKLVLEINETMSTAERFSETFETPTTLQQTPSLAQAQLRHILQEESENDGTVFYRNSEEKALGMIGHVSIESCHEWGILEEMEDIQRLLLDPKAEPKLRRIMGQHDPGYYKKKGSVYQLVITIQPYHRAASIPLGGLARRADQ